MIKHIIFNKNYDIMTLLRVKNKTEVILTVENVRNSKFFRLSALKNLEKLSIFLFGGQRLERELSPPKKPNKIRVEIILLHVLRIL